MQESAQSAITGRDSTGAKSQEEGDDDWEVPMKAEQLLQQVKAGELKPEEFVEQARALPTAEAEKLLDLLLKYVNQPGEPVDRKE
jgi:hypothetical protein